VSARSVGVEEEFLLVDRETGRVRGSAPAVLPRLAELDRGEAEPELTRQQVEVSTPVVSSLGELRAELARLRRLVVDRAADAGVAVIASGTSPFPGEGQTTDKRRYLTMMERYGPVGRVQLTCGCHVHVGVASPEEAVAVLDRIRGWLPVLRALSANSPFWRGEDTTYASYRTQVWGRWPSAGPVDVFGSARAYDDAVDALVDSGVLVDAGMVYFDARVSRRYPTVEIRVADVCQTVDETVALAGLSRALVATAAAQWAAGVEPPRIRTDLLRGATWRASRSGIAGELVDVDNARPAPAQDMVGRLVEHVEQALDEAGDGEVRGLVDDLLRRGDGASRQRAVFEKRAELSDVVDLVTLR